MHHFHPQTPDWEQRVRSSFARQGLMRSLHAVIDHIRPGELSITMPADPAFSQQHGYVHGGAIASILDSACGYAALSLMPADREVLTVEFKINFLSPARGSRFIATGRVIRTGRAVTVCTGEAIALDGDRRATIALMQATMFAVPASPTT
ncbi:PaaI family thioesterase [Chloroflexus sp.]|uniref:PaaI family thioesterase n=1 Tax=Chloroflexus sp. TaxID=1904827 RepID=UPI00261D86F9|nr:PaaI family thioesterase [uncultured Chloroflexus sp.]